MKPIIAALLLSAVALPALAGDYSCKQYLADLNTAASGSGDGHEGGRQFLVASGFVSGAFFGATGYDMADASAEKFAAFTRELKMACSSNPQTDPTHVALDVVRTWRSAQ